jgi:hypothetical protein
MKKRSKGFSSPRIADSIVTYYGKTDTKVISASKTRRLSPRISEAESRRGEAPAANKTDVNPPPPPPPVAVIVEPIPASQIPPLPVKVTVSGATAKAKRPTRPSLSEQLASIAGKAGELTRDMQKKHNLGQESNPGSSMLCSVPVMSFTVGKLTCRYPSPVHFYTDRCEFPFHHPFENSVIQMVMYFRDMNSITLNSRRMSFNIPNQLVHFKLDYNPAMHTVVIEFVAKSAADEIRRKVASIR